MLDSASGMVDVQHMVPVLVGQEQEQELAHRPLDASAHTMGCRVAAPAHIVVLPVHLLELVFGVTAFAVGSSQAALRAVGSVPAQSSSVVVELGVSVVAAGVCGHEKVDCYVQASLCMRLVLRVAAQSTLRTR